ncbi:MAG: hypothetical protein ACP5JJ_02915, partial [Anaerolineae bacterium]
METADQDLRSFPHRTSALEDVRIWQEQLMRVTLRILVIVGPVAAIAGSIYDYSRGVYWSIPLYWLAYGILAVVTYWRQVPYSWQVVVIVCLVYGLAIIEFVSDGREGNGRVFVLLVPLLASVFLGLQEGILSAALVPITMLGIGWALSTGRIPLAQPAGPVDLAGWVTDAVIMSMIGAFIVVAQNQVVPRLARALTESRDLARQFEDQRDQLEARVSEQAADLAHRNIQLRTAAQVARDVLDAQGVESLLD